MPLLDSRSVAGLCVGSEITFYRVLARALLPSAAGEGAPREAPSEAGECSHLVVFQLLPVG